MSPRRGDSRATTSRRLGPPPRRLGHRRRASTASSSLSMAASSGAQKGTLYALSSLTIAVHLLPPLPSPTPASWASWLAESGPPMAGSGIFKPLAAVSAASAPPRRRRRPARGCRRLDLARPGLEGPAAGSRQLGCRRLAGRRNPCLQVLAGGAVTQPACGVADTPRPPPSCYDGRLRAVS